MDFVERYDGPLQYFFGWAFKSTNEFDQRVHAARLELEHASQQAETSVGGSRTAQFAACAANDLAGLDSNPFVHPVAQSAGVAAVVAWLPRVPRTKTAFL